MTWRWLPVRPGVLALSGTPFQVERDRLATGAQGWWISHNGKRIVCQAQGHRAKQDCERWAAELIAIKDPRKETP